LLPHRGRVERRGPSVCVPFSFLSVCPNQSRGVLSLATGRTTILQGVVHLVLFAVYLFMTVFP